MDPAPYSLESEVIARPHCRVQITWDKPLIPSAADRFLRVAELRQAIFDPALLPFERTNLLSVDLGGPGFIRVVLHSVRISDAHIAQTNRARQRSAGMSIAELRTILDGAGLAESDLTNVFGVRNHGSDGLIFRTGTEDSDGNWWTEWRQEDGDEF